jgi:hypothetical protein
MQFYFGIMVSKHHRNLIIIVRAVFEKTVTLWPVWKATIRAGMFIFTGTVLHVR